MKYKQGKAIVVIAIIIGVIVLFGLSLIGSYNGMVQQRLAVETSSAQIQTQYQRRFDLIPNLVAATKGYLKQEQTVFNDIAQARTHYAGTPSGSAAQVQAAGSLDSALGRLMVIVEAYPDLKSNQTVADLMTELTGTENRIGVARQRYNEVAQQYNTSIKMFPRNILAGMFGFTAEPFYQADTQAATAPTVDLTN